MEEKKKTSAAAWTALVVIVILAVACVVGFITEVRGEPGYEWCSANYQTQYMSCSTTHRQCETARTQYPNLLQHPCTRVSTQVRHFCIRGNGCYLSARACYHARRPQTEECEYITHTESFQPRPVRAQVQPLPETERNYTVSITATPQDAWIVVDNHFTVPGQFSHEFVSDGILHQVTVRASGYLSQSFEFSGPMSRQVTLTRDSADESVPAIRTVPTRTQQPGTLLLR